MSGSRTDNSSRSPHAASESDGLSRRQLLTAAGAGAAAVFLEQAGVAHGQTPSAASGTIVFAHTTVVTVDSVQEDAALAVAGDRIVAIGPSDTILRNYSSAQVYEGRGKALFPGLINCHAHLAATLERGFNEDFGFPNSARLAVRPASLLQGEEGTLMVTIGALEAIRTGTTTIVENSGGISRSAAALAQTGLRCVFAESIRDSENVAGPMSPDGLAKSAAPKFSPRLRDEGMQRINDLFTAWHGAKRGRISVFPAAALAKPRHPAPAGRPCLRRETILVTPSICRRAAPKWISCSSTMARARRPFSPGTASSVRGCSPRTAGTWTRRTSRCSANRAPS
jgi:hypothetical protein